MSKKKPSASLDPECIQARDALIDQYIQKHGGRYRHLRAAGDIHSSSDNFAVTQALFGREAASQRDAMKALSNRYFDFQIEFFKFSRRPDRTFGDLPRRPLTHSDLVEEDIELKFPEDRKARALIKAFHLVIRDNQWRHVRRKRFWQSFLAACIVLLAGLWLHYGYWACKTVTAWLTKNAIIGAVLPWVLWTGILAFAGAAMWVAARWILVKRLENTTDHFKEANQTSSANLRASMTSFNASVSMRFTNLLNVIKSSEDNSELVKEKNWPTLSRELFKIAMWEGKRIESMEQYWQLQFERLRLLELWSDRLGNLSSVVVAVVMIAFAAVVLLICSAGLGDWGVAPRFAVTFVICTIGAWRMGAISRRPDLSFGMQDIIDQGFEGEWQAFGALGYYDKIAQEFENGMGAKRMEKIRDRNL